MSAARDSLDIFTPTPEEQCVYGYLKDGAQLAYDGIDGDVTQRLYQMWTKSKRSAVETEENDLSWDAFFRLFVAETEPETVDGTFARDSSLKLLLTGPPEMQTLGERLGFWPSGKPPTFKETFNEAFSVQTVAGVMRSPSFKSSDPRFTEARRTRDVLTPRRKAQGRRRMVEEISLLIVLEIAWGVSFSTQGSEGNSHIFTTARFLTWKCHTSESPIRRRNSRR